MKRTFGGIYECDLCGRIDMKGDTPPTGFRVDVGTQRVERAEPADVTFHLCARCLSGIREESP